MPSANRDNFTYAFPIWMTFVSCLIALASISSTILDKSGAKGQCCLIPDLREKAFDKTQHHLWYLNIIKSISDKPTANILNGEKLKAFPLRPGKKQGFSLSSLLFNIVLESLARVIRQKINKRRSNWNGRTTTVTVPYNMILCIEYHQEATKKLLE